MINFDFKIILVAGNAFETHLKCFRVMSNEQISLSYLFDV